MNKIRWGILSTANIGKKRVIPAIQNSSNGEVVAVASRTMERAQACAAELNIPIAYGSYEELIASDEIDAIYIPVPNSEHAEWSIKCANAGIPTLCEKPLAIDADEAQKMVDAFDEQTVLFAEAFMYRFHPQIDTVRSLIEDGTIGDVKVISATFGFNIGSRPDNIRWSEALAGGSLMDVGCYCINVMRLLTDEMPETVSAQAVMADSGVDESLVGTLKFSSGVIGHFDSSLHTSPMRHMVEIRGTLGTIRLPQSFVPTPNQPVSFDVITGDHTEVVEIEAADHYQIMAEDFADALLNERPPRFLPQDAVENMQVIDMLKATLG